jgi:hypothetical protein
MKKHLEEMIKEFPKTLPESLRKCPWNEDESKCKAARK